MEREKRYSLHTIDYFITVLPIFQMNKILND